MFEFYWTWAFLLLPLPFLIRRFTRSVKSNEQSALHVPFIDDFQAQTRLPRFNRTRLLLLLAALSWIALIVALARPVWVGDSIELPSNGRNLMLAVDLSGSMREQDFVMDGLRVNRLMATKKIAGDFIRRREGDKIGLILFGDQAYLQSPLTFDRQTVYRLLQESQLGLAGKRTAIGDAIGLAVKHAGKNPDEEHVLVLMTDGEASAGVEVDKAAELAADAGIKVYTVGIGSNENSFDAFFNNVSALDEEVLNMIADITGGQYFAARNTKQFENIYELLDKLEPVEQEQEKWRPRVDLFYWPLLVALMLALGVVLLRQRLLSSG